MIMEVLIKQVPECLIELRRSVETPYSEDLLPRVFPQPLYYVEVWGIRRQEDKLDTELRSHLNDGAAVLVAGIIEHDGHSKVSGCLPYLFN